MLVVRIGHLDVDDWYPVRVEGGPIGRDLLLDPFGRKLVLSGRLLGLLELGPELLDLLVLLPHLGAQALSIKLGSTFLVELLAHLGLRPSPLGARFKDVDSAAVGRYTEHDGIGLDNNKTGDNAVVLTAHHRAGLECPSDGGVHVQQQIMFYRQLVVAIAYLLPDPTLEVLSDQGVDQVDDPLTRQSAHIAISWEVVLHHRVLDTGLQNLLDCEPFVVRYVDVLRLGLLDDYNNGQQRWQILTQLFAHDDVL